MADVLAAATVNLRCNRTAFDKTIQQLKSQLPNITKGLSNKLKIAPTIDIRQIRSRVAKAVKGMRPVAGPQIIPTLRTHHLRAELIKAAKRLPKVAGPFITPTVNTAALSQSLAAAAQRIRRTQMPPIHLNVDSSALQRLPSMVRGIRMPAVSMPTGGFLKHAAAVTAGTAAYHALSAGIRGAFGASKSLTTAMLSSNAAMQSQTVTIEHFLGSAQKATKFMEQLRGLALDSPLSELGAIDAGKDLLMAGFEFKKIPQLVKTLGDASAASADGLAVTLKGLSRVVKQIKDKGKIDRGDAIQFSTAGINLPKALSDLGTLESIQERLASGSLNIDQVLAAMFKGLDRDYGGLMEKQSKTLGGMFDRMAEIAQQSIRKIGEPLAAFAQINLGNMLNFADSGAFTAQIDQLRTALSKTLAELSRLGQQAGGLQALSKWGGLAVDSLQAIPAMIRVAGEAFMGLANMAAASWKTIASFTGLESVFSGLMTSTTQASGIFRLLGSDAAATMKMAKASMVAMFATVGERMRQFAHSLAAVPAGILGAMHGVATKLPQIFSIAFDAVTKIGKMAWPAIINELKAQLEVAKDAIDLVFAHMLGGAMKIAPELAKRIALAMSGISFITGGGDSGLAEDLETGVKEREQARKEEAKGKTGVKDPRLADVARVALQANDQIGSLLRDGIADGYRNGAEMFKDAFPLANNDFLAQARKNAAAATIAAAAGMNKIKPPEMGGSITDALKGVFGSLKDDFAGLGSAAGGMIAQRFGGVMQQIQGMEMPSIGVEKSKPAAMRFQGLEDFSKSIQEKLSPDRGLKLQAQHIAIAKQGNEKLERIAKKLDKPQQPYRPVYV